MFDHSRTRQLIDKALERAYADDGRRPDLVLSQRALVSAKNELSHTVMGNAESHLVRRDLDPYVRNLVRAVWLRTLADTESQHTRDRSNEYDMRVIDLITDELKQIPLGLNKDMEPYWLPSCAAAFTGLTEYAPTNISAESAAEYTSRLITSALTPEATGQLARILDTGSDVFTIIDRLHVPAVERMVSWSVVSSWMNMPLPRTTLLAVTDKLSTVIKTTNEVQLNMTRDLISNYNVTMDMAAHVLEMAQCEDSRTLSLYALTRGKMYPVGVDWRAVVDMFKTVGSAELVEELFGAE